MITLTGVVDAVNVRVESTEGGFQEGDDDGITIAEEYSEAMVLSGWVAQAKSRLLMFQTTTTGSFLFGRLQCNTTLVLCWRVH